MTEFLAFIPMLLAADAAAPPAKSAPVAPPPTAHLGVGLARQASTFAHSTDALFWFIFWLCVFFFAVLMGLSGYFVLKYRRRPGVPQLRSVNHNTPLELVWSVGPLVILFGVFYWGFDLYMNLQVAPANSEEIQVTAQKWNWNWEYDNGAVGGSGGAEFRATVADMDVPVFAIPADRPVKLILHSVDVMHSSYVPDFRTKIDVYPNRYTTMWFQAPKAGEDHYLFCAEYCGEKHSQMAAVVKVLDENSYQSYKTKNAFDPATMPAKDWGKILYQTKGCNACHLIEKDGTGPKWVGVYGHEVEFIDGSKLIADENYLKESILEPSKHVVKGFSNQMTSFQGLLKDKELSALIAFIKSLSDKGQAELEAEKSSGTAGGSGGSGGAAPAEKKQ